MNNLDHKASLADASQKVHSAMKGQKNQTSNVPDSHVQKSGSSAQAEVSSDSPEQDTATQAKHIQSEHIQTEHNGPRGLEPTRYGDWESKGRCVDF